MPRLFRFHALEILVILVVLSAAVWLIPQFGSQHDEILFTKPVFDSTMSHATLVVFQNPLPLMMMSYLGALKVYVYKVIFSIFPPSLWSLRLPTLVALLGATLLIRSALIRIGMPVAATAFFVLFLASPVILVTGVFDWGPVCLQLLFFGSITYFLARASIDHRLKWFGLAGLFFGLGVWDKLTFLLCFAPVTMCW